MANERLFYGNLSEATIYSAGNNSFIRVSFDCDVASKTLTAVNDISSYHGLDFALAGQTLISKTAFPNGVTITGVNTSSQTITVADFPSATTSGEVGRISPPKGQYFVESASLSNTPTNNPITFVDITGSHDSIFQSTDQKYGVLLVLASTSSVYSAISGEIGQYEITRFKHRKGRREASFYISSSQYGVLSEPADKQVAANVTTFPIVELSYSSSLAPIFDQEESRTPAGGYEVGAYQTSLTQFYDDLALDVYYEGTSISRNVSYTEFSGSSVKNITATTKSRGQSGVLIEIEPSGSNLDILKNSTTVQNNISFIDFSGSGVGDISVSQSSGEIGVVITLDTGSLADEDWYIGDTYLTSSKDVRITGSLHITTQNTSSDFFIITSGSYDIFKFNSEGTAQFFAHDDISYPNPTAIYGGLHFQSSSVWVGID